ncbi:patatin-like phospholipase family protein [Rhodobacteraceae bacterium 2CG4]|uniref:Patatin-like phospholipase family protein n=1 Tax=Halovulum marinum TaxID=2662447 RepID=A0A6L5YVQ6_9RHOB|nr:patatin-like phospholipase family protein [Halovulum marinum]MSU88456.1 patatin-like phospholipase family protein [Halovulum marinum]
MNKHSKAKSNGSALGELSAEVGQVVLVLQGGGALGAYQAGVYEALHDAGVEPDWVIGTSIGAINAALIAGNAPGDRLTALRDFWQLMSRRGMLDPVLELLPAAPPLAFWSTLFGGQKGFFEPNLRAFMGAHMPLGEEHAGYYSTAPLRETLAELLDVDRLNHSTPRLTVGAAEVCTSMMHYFDSRDGALSMDHILASGALPPAFPAVRIDGKLYWDGGILSNTPTEVVFDDNPRRNSLIFAVHLWNPVGEEPGTIWEVMHRQKNVQYSSRVASHIARQKQAHRMRHIINDLAAYLPEGARARPEVRELLSYGCQTRMHVVRLLAPSLEREDQTKDVDFSWNGVRKRWQAGYEHTSKALQRAPWREAFDPLEGVILHDAPEPDELLRATA